MTDKSNLENSPLKMTYKKIKDKLKKTARNEIESYVDAYIEVNKSSNTHI